MTLGTYLYRFLTPDEKPENGLVARDPSATSVSVESHIVGKKMSPYISTCATQDAVEMWVSLAKAEDKKNNVKRSYTVVRIDVAKLRKEEGVEIIDLTDSTVLDNNIKKENKRARNYVAKYKEVLIKGKVPAKCVEVVLEYAESSSYEYSDYTEDEDNVDSLSSGMSGIRLK